MSGFGYGALLRVDGKLINKNMDMDVSDTGYMLDKATYPVSDTYPVKIKCNMVINYDIHDYYLTETDIKGEYDVYAGDEKLMLVFYKSGFMAISEGKVVLFMVNFSSKGQIFSIPNLTDISVYHLDKDQRVKHQDTSEDLHQRLIDKYGKREGDKQFQKVCRKPKKATFRQYPSRYIATWTHNNKKYEVIYGYGIDNYEDDWNYIKNEDKRDLSEYEIDIIDRWFKS